MESESTSGDVTQLLEEIRGGNPAAEAALAELVYDRLYAIARNAQPNGGEGFTLGPTALVNEAFVRLKHYEVLKKSPNRHFLFAAAGRAMRQLVVDHFRKRQSQKRGGDRQRVPLDDLLDYYQVVQRVDLVELHDLLDQLEKIDSRKAQVVQLKFFLGMTMVEIAEQLDVSLRTIETDWRTARAFLKTHLTDSDPR